MTKGIKKQRNHITNLTIGLLMSVLTALTPVAAEVLSTTFYHNDALGSPVAATDENGTVKWREQYRPYGDKINNDLEALTDNSRWYTGHPHDESTGLTYAGARYYDPVVGRFMAIDPVGVPGSVESNPMMFNRYAYANNNPYKFVDPDGRTSWPVNKNKNGQVVITSQFGPRNTGIPGASSEHSGTDFRAWKGADIKATENGTITKIGSSSRAGNYILISNDDGSMSGHAHTGAIPGLKEGDKVAEGSTIGASDGSGTGNAPHQHYNYREGTTSNPATQSTPKVDPMKTQFKNMPKKEVCVKGNDGC